MPVFLQKIFYRKLILPIFKSLKFMNSDLINRAAKVIDINTRNIEHKQEKALELTKK